MTADRLDGTARTLALLLCLAGAVAIGLGWNAVASRADAGSQLPYLLSGGAAGIGLVTLGVGVLLAAQILVERRRVAAMVDVTDGDVVARAREYVAVAGRIESGGGRPGFQVRGARVLALVFAGAGFAMIALGWNGMAGASTTDQQLPYLMSGGFGGVALILIAVALLLIAQMRTERRKLMDVLMAVAVVSPAPRPPDGPARQQQPPKAKAAAEPRTVVAGPSTYHRPDCRLVQGTPSLDRVTAGAARASGRSPCRVCDPDGPSTNGRAAPEPNRASGQHASV
ncbi:MAG TPA: hypothetical protein VNN79_18445 [Actinomycetota bacterium]|nr:hypothetical protein [Actinomycetota bacterium]